MRITSLCLLVLLLTGCATMHPRTQSRPSAVALPTGDVSLSAFEQQVRGQSPRARNRASDALVAERWSQDLAAAISLHAASPTHASEVGLGQAYVRAGILDQAHQHFETAARLDPHDGDAWDGLARIWRDWGFPYIGLGDAYRAVSASPRSPAVHNTLGTILQFLGNGREARAQFARALALDPGAAYAYNNLCYSWLTEANADAAEIACDNALAIDPGLVPARNNLALVRAIDGDLKSATQLFGEAAGEAAAQYNLGMVHVSQRRYSAAADAFDRAAVLNPALILARVRARQARQQAVDAPEGEGGIHDRR